MVFNYPCMYTQLKQTYVYNVHSICSYKIVLCALMLPTPSILSILSKNSSACSSGTDEIEKAQVQTATGPTECDDKLSKRDHVAYERNHARLLIESRRAVPNRERMTQLIKETHQKRRSHLNMSYKKLMTLLHRYPYFAHKKWVSLHVPG